MAKLAGGENDMLFENPFGSSESRPDEGGAPNQVIGSSGGANTGSSGDNMDDDLNDMDENLLNEIEDYLKGVMECNEKVIDMSDSQIGSGGAKCVATAITFCEGLEEMRLANCGIKDAGARSIFEELLASHSVTHVDLSGNPITEKCFDSLSKLLTSNSSIR